MNVATPRRGLSFFVLMLALELGVMVAHCQVADVSRLRDVPRTSELEKFKQALATQPKPIDSSGLYNQIQRTQYTRQRLLDMKGQPSQIDSVKSASDRALAELLSSLSDPKSFCKPTSSAQDVIEWWDGKYFERLNSSLMSTADYVGVQTTYLRDPAPSPKGNETCQQYTPELLAAVKGFQKDFSDSLSQYQQIEQERLKNIPDVDNAYKARSESLTEDLEKARQRQQENTAVSLANDLWAIILVLGGIALGILLLVRWLPCAGAAGTGAIRAGHTVHHCVIALDCDHGTGVIGEYQRKHPRDSPWRFSWVCLIPGRWTCCSACGPKNASGSNREARGFKIIFRRCDDAGLANPAPELVSPAGKQNSG